VHIIKQLIGPLHQHNQNFKFTPSKIIEYRDDQGNPGDGSPQQGPVAEPMEVSK